MLRVANNGVLAETARYVDRVEAELHARDVEHERAELLIGEGGADSTEPRCKIGNQFIEVRGRWFSHAGAK